MSSDSKEAGALRLIQSDARKGKKMSRSLIYPLAAVAMVVGAMLAGALPSSASVKGATKTVKVPATRPWTDTGISLSKGEKFTINASGRVTMDNGADYVGPNGTPISGNNSRSNFCLSLQYSYPVPFPAERVPCWSLIGKIGSSGLPVFIGMRGFSAQSPVSGELYLGFNDQVLSDNRGAFKAKISAG